MQPNWVEALDELAYLLATCPDLQWRDPARAIKLSTQANELTRRSSAEILETLATAYAAAGDFTNAVATAQRAQKETAEKALETKLQGDIESYRAGKIAPLDWKTPRSSVMIQQ